MLALYFTCFDDDINKRLFADIFYSYRKQMVAVSCSILNNQADAEDVVSNLFLSIAQKNWDTVRSIQSDTDLRNYLLKAAKNASLNIIKSKTNENISLNAVSEYQVDSKKLTDNTFLEVICDKIEYDEAVKAIKSLDEKYRDALYYHFVLELTIPTTAKSLNQTVAATKKQLVRGKKMLLNLLGIKGVE